MSVDHYDEFVARYYDSGSADIPPDWPEDVRRRCRFFLRMAEDAPLELTCSSGTCSSADAAAPGDREGLVIDRWGQSRYELERELARGGMGRVLLAYDRDLRRRVAIKILPGAARGAARVSRFVGEAQATAQLEHPNIGPVYDIGESASGAPFFTMKWIRGRDLDQVLRLERDTWSLIRLLQVLQQAIMGVEFAHSRGVVHRDLKPHNIMVGDFGEVLVVDWGLAKILGSDRDGASGHDVSTERGERGVRSIDGAVQGSVQYMAPEQARGEVRHTDVRTDVWGIGAVLYRILCGEPPYRAPSFEGTLACARAGVVESPSARRPGADIPAELESICLRALAPDRTERFPTARAVHDALQRYIEGIHDTERRAAEAARLLAVAGRTAAEWTEARARLEERARRSEELEGTTQPHAPEAEKSALWSALEARQRAEAEAARLFTRVGEDYHAVLSVDPANRAARVALADLYLERMLEHEARGEAEAASFCQSLVERYDDGRHAAALTGDAELVLISEPTGAAVFVSRYEERGPLLVEGPAERAGETPLRARLPRGSYLATLKKPGCVDVRLPLLVDRPERVEASVRLYSVGAIPDGFVQVPAGESIIGGDHHLATALPRERRRVEEFFIGRFPVRFREYCAFLAEILGERSIDEALADAELGLLVPAFGVERYVERRSEGPLTAIGRMGDEAPVLSILPAAMDRYCDWLGARLGRAVRLPTEIEWERSARGADGRLHPWGNRFDWSLAKGARSRPGDPVPEAVGAFPRDVSPFGVRDLAGGVREVCAGNTEAGYRVTRGGSWVNPNARLFVASFRSLSRERHKSTDMGFRVCFSPAADTDSGSSA